MPNGQDPSKPSQKPGSGSGTGTGTGGGTGTGVGPASGVPGKIKPQEDDRPPQTKVMTAAIVGLIDRVIGGLSGVAYCAD
jgi:hypothetical protein